jgi:hypothetical protein
MAIRLLVNTKIGPFWSAEAALQKFWTDLKKKSAFVNQLGAIFKGPSCIFNVIVDDANVSPAKIDLS